MKSSIASSTTTTAPSDISNRLKKRNRKPPACAPCRAKKLRCDRTLPSCTSCLSRPDVEHCDYYSTSSRFGRCGTRSCRSGTSTVPATATPMGLVDRQQQQQQQQRQQPTPPDDDDDDDAVLPDADADADVMAVEDNDGTIRPGDEDGEQDQDEKPSERTMREKLERLERMIASLMESRACNRGPSSCPSKKRPAPDQTSDAETKSSALAPSNSNCSWRLGSSREGDSMWTTLLNEKIQKWQQGLSRHQATSPALGADVQDKT